MEILDGRKIDVIEANNVKIVQRIEANYRSVGMSYT